MARITAPTLVDVVRGIARARGRRRARALVRPPRVELLDVSLTATGAERVPPGRAYVYMSNHQSHLDIPMLYATLPSPTIRMLAKKELFQIPLWGRGLRAAEFIEVDRSEPRRARCRSIEYAARLIRDGVSDLPRARRHALARRQDRHAQEGRLSPRDRTPATPIVPVAIRGTIDILPRGAQVDADRQARRGDDRRADRGRGPRDRRT